MSSVLITGTSRGIGLEAALAFGRAGHHVYATMRSPERSPVLAKIVAREKLPVTISAMDVDSDQSVSEGIAAIQREHGPIEVLVNNAGIERTGPIEELSLADFRAVMETNYFGIIRCVKAVVPDMRRRRSGCIINVSSVAGRLSSPPTTPYHASKWALEAFSEALAAEMKTFNVRVAIVEPGIIDTDMARRISEQPGDSPYRQAPRFAAVFAEALKNPASATLVSSKILEIAESGSWQLRHLVGPDAAQFVHWRHSMSDEQWVDLNAGDDDNWYRVVERDFGMDARPKK